ncbi:MAG: T9SS type A sorting domain-containing protein [Saprospirales bacterium]|nr:T9SS type A sorting domain-containing protein [Saprospirales bacterium]MBK8489642.1 T9SS type A sorting domain-containing protein [Saprospirales bacterium]
MKSFFRILFFFVLTTAWAQAQITITSAYFPAANDTLKTATDNMPDGIDIGNPGGPQTWNFTSLQAPFITNTTFLDASTGGAFSSFLNAELMVELPGSNEAYYNLTANKLEYMGYYGNDPIGLGINLVVRYSPPLIERRAPLNYQNAYETTSNLLLPFSADDIPGGFLDSLPITPDSFRLRINIVRTEEVDAFGTLQIPGAFYDVLRMKRIDVNQTRLDAKLPFINWTDITDLVPSNPFLGEITTKSYFYFSNMAKEPIAVVSVDPTTDDPTRVEFKVVDETINSSLSLSNQQASLYAFPNPSYGEVRFDFQNLATGNYEIKIYNILGMEVWQKEFWVSGSKSIKVNLDQLRKGTYLYSLVNSRGKTLATKRLMIVRP